MHRKITIMALLIIAVITGCSATPSSTYSADEPQAKTSEAIPDPEKMFPDANVAILVYNTPKTYYQVTNYKDGDYESYVDACVEAGFDDIQFKGGTDGNDMFLAYDANHEFYLELGISPDVGIIHITCSPAKEDSQ